LPSAIVAGQSAGWSGFPYWGSDIGGYFGSPDDEVFVRWAQFAAFTPIMQAHGLGIREPWLFRHSTLEVYRRFANLHARLVPYSRAAAAVARRTGMPLMRAMALCFPEDPDIHQDWIQYQYLYGPDLLVAPVYSWGTTRQVYFPAGEWIDYFTGSPVSGPLAVRVPAPLESIPVFVRAGTVLPLLRDIATPSASALELQMFPGGAAERLLADGTRIVLESEPPAATRLSVNGPERDYVLSVPHGSIGQVSHSSQPVTRVGESLRWRGEVTLDLEVLPLPLGEGRG
jgi:alpha-D-xyloside xylohydrolase